jgi:hypothetical protein
MAILSGFTFVLLVNRRPGVGRILFELTEEHGVHAGDVPVVGLWVLGMVCCVLLLRDAGRDASRQPPA